MVLKEGRTCVQMCQRYVSECCSSILELNLVILAQAVYFPLLQKSCFSNLLFIKILVFFSLRLLTTMLLLGYFKHQEIISHLE